MLTCILVNIVYNCLPQRATIVCSFQPAARIKVPAVRVVILPAHQRHHALPRSRTVSRSSRSCTFSLRLRVRKGASDTGDSISDKYGSKDFKDLKCLMAVATSAGGVNGYTSGHSNDNAERLHTHIQTSMYENVHTCICPLYIYTLCARSYVLSMYDTRPHEHACPPPWCASWG